jgi:hypothetical protein
MHMHPRPPAQTEEKKWPTVLGYTCFDSVSSGMNIPQGREVQAESDQISTNPPANGTHSTPDARVAALRQSQSPKEVSTVGSGGKGHVA